MRNGHFDEGSGRKVTIAVIAGSGSSGFTAVPAPDATRPSGIGLWREIFSVANGSNSTSSSTAHQIRYRVAAFSRGIDRTATHITAATAAACHKLFRTSMRVFIVHPL